MVPGAEDLCGGVGDGADRDLRVPSDPARAEAEKRRAGGLDGLHGHWATRTMAHGRMAILRKNPWKKNSFQA